MNLLHSAALGLILLGSVLPASAQEIASTYTKHAYEQCRELPSPEPDVVELRECDGVGGVKVRWGNGPDASWIQFSEADQDLRLGSFFVVGPTIEWRGPVVNGVIEPRTAIVRYHTGSNVGSLSKSSLVIYRLAGEACAVAVQPGNVPKANEVARLTADETGEDTPCY
jgi:hypothetical protein